MTQAHTVDLFYTSSRSPRMDHNPSICAPIQNGCPVTPLATATFEEKMFWRGLVIVQDDVISQTIPSHRHHKATRTRLPPRRIMSHQGKLQRLAKIVATYPHPPIQQRQETQQRDPPRSPASTMRPSHRIPPQRYNPQKITSAR
jgi:hypothetical protein